MILLNLYVSKNNTLLHTAITKASTGCDGHHFDRVDFRLRETHCLNKNTSVMVELVKVAISASQQFA